MIVATVKILVSVYSIGAGIIVVSIFSIASYIVFQFLVSGMDATLDQFGTGEIVGSFPILYFAMFLFVGTFGLTDNALENLRKFMKIRRLEKAEKAEIEKKAQELSDPR